MKKMVILHLTTRAAGGGAADYTLNMHRNMVHAGYKSYVAVYGHSIITPNSSEISIHLSPLPFRHKLQRKINNAYYRVFNPQNDEKYEPAGIHERICNFNAKDLVNAMPERPDVIFVHWVSFYANALYVRELQELTGADVYYIMIDQSILSGGCHYPWDCEGYKDGCLQCKINDSYIFRYFIRQNYKFKRKYLVDQKNVIAPTQFDVERLKQCSLWEGCRVYKLIEAVDENIFYPVRDNSDAKKRLFIPDGQKVVFFGCVDLAYPRKGMQRLIEALKKIRRNDTVFLVAGNNPIDDWTCPVINLGYVSHKTLADAYRAADVYVCPSLEDSGPQMINMSIISGTPVVAFEMGVAFDLVHTGKTGYRAKYNDSDDLASGIDYILHLTAEEHSRMRDRCHKLGMEKCSMKAQRDFFNNLFGRSTND